MSEFVVFDQPTARRIINATRKVERPEIVEPNKPPSGEPLPQRFIGKLNADLAAPTNGFTGPTSVSVSRYWIDPANGNLVDSGIDDTVYNHDKSRTGKSGAYCRYEFLYGKLSFYDVECS